MLGVQDDPDERPYLGVHNSTLTGTRKLFVGKAGDMQFPRSRHKTKSKTSKH